MLSNEPKMNIVHCF